MMFAYRVSVVIEDYMREGTCQSAQVKRRAPLVSVKGQAVKERPTEAHHYANTAVVMRCALTSDFPPCPTSPAPSPPPQIASTAKSAQGIVVTHQ